VSTATGDPLQGLAVTFALCMVVLVAGLTAIFQATAGGTAFTTEALRRTAVSQAPVAVPDYPVVDAQGQFHSLHGLLGQGARVVIVDFVYTRCTTLCLALGTVFQQLQAQIVEQGLQERVGLLSISFDPLQDQPPALAAYAERMRMQPAVWHVVSLRSDADRRRLLDSFGIMVVPAPLGEFEHNAALHIVSPQGQLVHILGLGDGELALELARVLAVVPQQSGAQ
jgi:protein SCO1/2